MTALWRALGAGVVTIILAGACTGQSLPRLPSTHVLSPIEVSPGQVLYQSMTLLTLARATIRLEVTALRAGGQPGLRVRIERPDGRRIEAERLVASRSEPFGELRIEGGALVRFQAPSRGEYRLVLDNHSDAVAAKRVALTLTY